MESNGVDKIMEYTNKEYYSKKQRGFFSGIDREAYEQSPQGWPSDVVEITAEYKEELFKKQAQGYEIVGDKNGYPVVVLNAPSAEELAEGKRATLLSEADAVIQPMLGYAVSGILADTEKKTLKAWNEYRKALEDIDVTATDIEWPAKPE